ncbi:hypothetical protein GCM10010336_61840 [Streptomyces goshikiensis]|nr:hypothetical protein GCM10010336_61840 [Streptomyces goshikiensis]
MQPTTSGRATRWREGPASGAAPGVRTGVSGGSAPGPTLAAYNGLLHCSVRGGQGTTASDQDLHWTTFKGAWKSFTKINGAWSADSPAPFRCFLAHSGAQGLRLPRREEPQQRTTQTLPRS